MTKTKFSPEAFDLADNILKAAGSGLHNYSMHKTREVILTAAEEAITAAKIKTAISIQEIARQASFDKGKMYVSGTDVYRAAQDTFEARSAA